MKRSWILGLLAAAGTGALVSCGDSEANNFDRGPDGYPYEVTTTVGMITDIVRNVAGKHAVVEGIIGEGTDPHLFLPSTPDVKALRSADVVFYNGLLLEGKMESVLKKIGRNKPVHAVTDAIRESGDYVMTDESDHYDPHVWMDVAGWITAVQTVKEALSKYDKVHAADYEENAAAYIARLRKLDDYAKKSIASIPEGHRVLVTAHDAFGYMARAYGLEVRGIQGISTEAKAGLRDIEELVAFLVERKIPAVFVESSVPRKNVEALIQGARAKGHEVTVGGELFSDAMGEAGTYEGTYIGMIDHNVTTITRALGGTAPAGGFAGEQEAAKKAIEESPTPSINPETPKKQ